jgi:hypothetical protein
VVAAKESEISQSGICLAVQFIPKSIGPVKKGKEGIATCTILEQSLDNIDRTLGGNQLSLSELAVENYAIYSKK